jgi:cytochrome P450
MTVVSSRSLNNIFDLRRKGIIDFYYDAWREHGDVVQIQMGPLNSFSFVRPEHIQHILVKNPDIYVKGMTHDKLRVAIGNGILTLEGERWFRQRRLMSPTYTPKGIRAFADIMTEEAKKLLARWRNTTDIVDINLEMTRVTMSVISRAMFGFDIGSDFKETITALYELLEYTSNTTNSLIDVPLFIPTPGNQRLKWAKQTIREFIFKIINQRRKEGLRDDLLSMLMSARDEDTGELMSDEQLHDEVLITIFAGHETTASLLTWTFYLLSRYPEVEARLHEELAQVLNGRTPTMDDLSNLPYTRMVLDETLRLYSPVPVLARDAAATDELAGYTISKGSMVTVVPYVTHRHPEFWEHPLAFYPEHFTPERVAQRPKYAYFPFGSGQRICLGIHFAQMEAALILAEVAQRYRVELARENNGSVRYIGVARPASPILVKLQPR